MVVVGLLLGHTYSKALTVDLGAYILNIIICLSFHLSKSELSPLKMSWFRIARCHFQFHVKWLLAVSTIPYTIE